MFVLGSDPEAFLRDKEGNVVSAIGVLPGTKENPFGTPNGSIQVDNILAEFNSRPAYSLQEFISNHKLIIGDLEDVLKPMDLRLDFMASYLADEALLSDPQSRVAGCDPDYSAWLLCEQEKADYSSVNTRAAGGHLHISFSQADDDDTELTTRIKFVRALDLVLGVPSVIHDRDTERRKYYGRAGSFRPKLLSMNDPYNGVEYRTLSNFWLKSEKLMAFIYKGVELVHDNLEELSGIAHSFKDDIIDIIDTGDYNRAVDLSDKLGIKYAV